PHAVSSKGTVRARESKYFFMRIGTFCVGGLICEVGLKPSAFHDDIVGDFEFLPGGRDGAEKGVSHGGSESVSKVSMPAYDDLVFAFHVFGFRDHDLCSCRVFRPCDGVLLAEVTSFFRITGSTRCERQG